MVSRAKGCENVGSGESAMLYLDARNNPYQWNTCSCCSRVSCGQDREIDLRATMKLAVPGQSRVRNTLEGLDRRPFSANGPSDGDHAINLTEILSHGIRWERSGKSCTIGRTGCFMRRIGLQHMKFAVERQELGPNLHEHEQLEILEREQSAGVCMLCMRKSNLRRGKAETINKSSKHHEKLQQWTR